MADEGSASEVFTVTGGIMVKSIVRDVFFLGQKSEDATKQDLSVGQDLQDTLKASRRTNLLQLK